MIGSERGSVICEINYVSPLRFPGLYQSVSISREHRQRQRIGDIGTRADFSWRRFIIFPRETRHQTITR